MTEDEMVGWHNRLNGHEFEQTLGGRFKREGTYLGSSGKDSACNVEDLGSILG